MTEHTWEQLRLGNITCSRFSDVMTNDRSGKGFGKTARTYMDEVISEILTQQPASQVKTFAMEHGHQYEPVARESYEQKSGNKVEDAGIVKLVGHRITGSPDGFVGTDGIIEIKCPLTFVPHLRVVESCCMPDEHTEQVQGYLWLTGRQWCDFISFHPLFPEPLQLMVIRVEANKEFHKQLEERVFAFECELMKRLKSIVQFMKGRT